MNTETVAIAAEHIGPAFDCIDIKCADNVKNNLRARCIAHTTRFASIAAAKNEGEITNIFQFLENAIFGTSNYLDNQLFLLKMIRALSLIDEDKHPIIAGALKKLEDLEQINAVVNMPRSDDAKLFEAVGLKVKHVTWEDTSRNFNSCWGSNITDLTLRLDHNGKDYYLPVVREENFKDVTADIDPNEFKVNVGNAKGRATEVMTLKQVLEEPWKLLHDESKWPVDENGDKIKLYVDGVDNQVLVSAQASFVPIPDGDDVNQATYRPHVFNYQSRPDWDGTMRPSVLTIVVTKDGCTIDVLGKQQGGQTLSHNKNGEKVPLTAKRPNVVEKAEMEVHKAMGLTAQENSDQHNRILIIQVPLVPPPAKPRPEMPRRARSGFTLGDTTVDSLSDFGGITKSFSPAKKTKGVKPTGAIKSYGSTVTYTNAGAMAGAGPIVSVGEVSDGAVYAQTTAIAASATEDFYSPMYATASLAPLPAPQRELDRARSIEDAVIGTGKAEGAFDENLGTGWKRDAKIPIRITVQLVKAADKGKLTKDQAQDIRIELEKVYAGASRIGSLVVAN